MWVWGWCGQGQRSAVIAANGREWGRAVHQSIWTVNELLPTVVRKTSFAIMLTGTYALARSRLPPLTTVSQWRLNRTSQLSFV